MKRLDTILIVYCVIAIASVSAQETTTHSAGFFKMISSDNLELGIIYIPGGIEFPTGIDDKGNQLSFQDQDAKDYIVKEFWIGETEITYDQWYSVITWATNEKRGECKYIFSNRGREGSTGDIGKTPTIKKNEPVTMISWRDALVWCNAATEYYNEHQNNTNIPLSLCYFYDEKYLHPIRTSLSDSAPLVDNGQIDNPYFNNDATGFRLPFSAEWEIAARWNGNISINSVAGYTEPYFIKGNSFSGGSMPVYESVDPIKVFDEIYEYAVLFINYRTSTAHTLPVKSKKPNYLQIFDLNGNVSEYCFDFHPSQRFHDYKISRGGGYGGGGTRSDPNGLQIGALFWVNTYTPGDSASSNGFRIVKY